MLFETKRNMRKIIIAVIFIISTVTTYGQEEVKWVGFEEAIELSKKNPKPILVDMYTDWCGWCKRMDATTYKNKTIVKYINENYYAVKMDGEGKEDITYQGKTFKYVEITKPNGRKGKYHEFAQAIFNTGKKPGERKGGSYPSTVIFNKKGQFTQVVPGYKKTEEFEKLLAFFGENVYKEKPLPWAEFQKSFKSNL